MSQAVHARLGGVANLARRLNDGHQYGLALLVSGEDWATAVCNREGAVLAWDGWYVGFNEPNPPQGSIDDLDWENWDDVPWELLYRELNAPWLSRELGHFLCPSYSVAIEAAELVVDHAASATSREAKRRIENARIAAYLPISSDETSHFEAVRDAGFERLKELEQRFK